MGTAKRYAAAVDRSMDERIAHGIMASGPPQSLGPEEIALDVEPLTRTPKPQRVRAWVRYPEGPLQVNAEAVAWTSRAVAIRWPVGAIEHKAWVWASAVESRQAQ